VFKNQVSSKVQQRTRSCFSTPVPPEVCTVLWTLVLKAWSELLQAGDLAFCVPAFRGKDSWWSRPR
jgi:hypothetical protein